MNRIFAVLLLGAALVAADHNCGLEAKVCQNGGVCHDSNTFSSSNPTISQEWTTPRCVCPMGYAGADCSYKIRTCADSPCQNGGKCLDSSCFSSGRNYECFRCVCPKGWTGAPEYSTTSNPGGLCDWAYPINDCTVGNKCAGVAGFTGNCSNVNTPYEGAYWSCSCPPQLIGGYGENCTRVTFDCRVTAPVSQGQCQNGGTCNVAGGCTCAAGFAGQTCEFDVCASNPCQNGATCNKFSGGYSCTCAPGWSGPSCNIPTCSVSNNFCQNGGTCSFPGSTFPCTCAPTFNGASCNATKFCNSNSTGGSPCINGGACTDLSSTQGGSGVCTCPAGWAGQFCEQEIGGCGNYFHGSGGCNLLGGGSCQCTSQLTCASSQWNTKCGCNAGFADCRCNSTYVPKCPTPSAANYNQYCQNGGTCVESQDKWACQCRTGFWGDKCQNYDNPCMNSPCKNGGHCYIDSENAGMPPTDDRFWAAHCECKWPYYGRYCENMAPLNGDVCSSNPCMNGGTCSRRYWTGNYEGTHDFYYVSYPGPALCTCPAGFYGDFCENPIPTCYPSANQFVCQNGGTCITSSNAPYARCACPCGTAGDNCEVVAANRVASAVAWGKGTGSGVGQIFRYCFDGLCKNGATCAENKDGQGFTCLCKSSWAGTYCQIKVLSAAAGVVPSFIAAAAAALIAIVAAKH